MAITIVIPVFNEKKGILETIDELRTIVTKFPWPVEIILVDDGSTDGTSEILMNIERDDLFRILSHSKNRGYGASLKTGIKNAQYDMVVISDADKTYPNHRIAELVQVFLDNKSDMLVGARTGVDVEIPLIRRPAKWCLKKVAEYLANMEIPDLNSGLRVMNKKVVQKFLSILPDGFSFTTTITLAMLTNGYQVKYIPIEYYKREGKSKIRPIRDTINFFQLIIRTVMYFDPLKIFLPMSLSLFLIGVVLLLYRIFIAKALITTIIVLFIASFQILAIGMLADLIDKRMKHE